MRYIARVPWFIRNLHSALFLRWPNRHFIRIYYACATIIRHVPVHIASLLRMQAPRNCWLHHPLGHPHDTHRVVLSRKL